MNKLFVAALKEETPGLDYFHYIGVGKINATYNLLKLINKFKPDLVINFGSAGAVKQGLSGIVECTKFYQRDMDVKGLLGLKLGETPFDKINEIINSDDGFSCGSGDSFVNSKIAMNVDLVDMEAYALAKVCKLENVKFRCFKYVSDNANENAPNEWTENCKKGAELFQNKLKVFDL